MIAFLVTILFSYSAGNDSRRSLPLRFSEKTSFGTEPANHLTWRNTPDRTWGSWLKGQPRICDAAQTPRPDQRIRGWVLQCRFLAATSITFGGCLCAEDVSRSTGSERSDGPEVETQTATQRCRRSWRRPGNIFDWFATSLLHKICKKSESIL